MGSYPECDKFECEECPRSFDCIDRDIEEVTGESSMHIEQAVIDEAAIIEYIDQRFNDIERRLFGLEKFQLKMQALMAKAVKTYEQED